MRIKVIGKEQVQARKDKFVSYISERCSATDKQEWTADLLDIEGLTSQDMHEILKERLSIAIDSAHNLIGVEREDGKPIAVIGVELYGGNKKEGKLGMGWSIYANHDRDTSRQFVKQWPDIFNKASEGFSSISNVISPDNKTMIRLLQNVGCKIKEVEDGQSIYFVWRSK